MATISPAEQRRLARLTRGYLGSLPHLRAAPEHLAFMNDLLLEAERRLAAPLIFRIPRPGVIVFGRQGRELVERPCDFRGAPLALAALSQESVSVQPTFALSNAGRNALARFAAWLSRQGEEGRDLAAAVSAISVRDDGTTVRPLGFDVLTG